MLPLSQMTTAERVHYGISRHAHESAVNLNDSLSFQAKFNYHSWPAPRLSLPMWAAITLALGVTYVV